MRAAGSAPPPAAYATLDDRRGLSWRRSRRRCRAAGGWRQRLRLRLARPPAGTAVTVQPQRPSPVLLLQPFLVPLGAQLHALPPHATGRWAVGGGGRASARRLHVFLGGGGGVAWRSRAQKVGPSGQGPAAGPWCRQRLPHARHARVCPDPASECSVTRCSGCWCCWKAAARREAALPPGASPEYPVAIRRGPYGTTSTHCC